jgi:molybdopterin molybdotransferase
MTSLRAVSGLSWLAARRTAYEAGRAAMLAPVTLPLSRCDQTTLADDVRAGTDMPAFPTSCVDGYAVRGQGPWRTTGRILAGEIATPLRLDGTATQIATGAMVPAGTEAVIRIEDSVTIDGLLTGTPRPRREWRLAGEDARAGEVLVPAGVPVTPAVIGLSAASGYDELLVRSRPRAAVIVLGSELLTRGKPADGRIRDALGPQLPAWLRRLGAEPGAPEVTGPVGDTLHEHTAAIERAQAAGADIIVTTGGTMHGPVDHLRAALRELNAVYEVDTVQVRPGSPMLLTTLTDSVRGTILLAGLPGNPQAAIIALVTLVAPALAGLTGGALPDLPTVELGGQIPARGSCTHLALVRQGHDGRGYPVSHAAAATLRGLAQSVGFAVIPPYDTAAIGTRVPLVPLPISPGELGPLVGSPPAA